MKIVVSGYPRSGNTWIQYCISEVTGHKCPKAHWYDCSTKNSDYWVFPIRNYKECITRHAKHGNVADDNIIDVILQQTEGNFCGNGPKTDYMDILSCYDRHEGLKSIVYYEDIITEPKNTLGKLFMEIGVDGTEFINDLDNHINKSISQYVGGSATNGKDILYHSLAFVKEERDKLDKSVCNRFPILFNKYLLRYKEHPN